MKYLRIFLFMLLLCACTPTTENVTITNSHGQSYTIEVEELSTFQKTAIVLLFASTIVTYKKQKISESITDHFSHFYLSWLSLGILVSAIFITIAEGTDPFYETMFATLGIILSLYYLYNQYHEAEDKHLSNKAMLTCLAIATLDTILLIYLEKVFALIFILVQILLSMILESKRFQNIND